MLDRRHFTATISSNITEQPLPSSGPVLTPQSHYSFGQSEVADERASWGLCPAEAGLRSH